MNQKFQQQSQSDEPLINPEETIKKANGYKSYLLEKLNHQRLMDPPMCDMCISADDRIFFVHKCLMIASCDYFAAMLRSGMQETRQDTIELKGVSSQGLGEVINFIYSGELKLNLNNIADILRAVSHLQVKYAIKLCEEFLIEETTVENCIDMLNLAEMFCIQNVKNEVNGYILRNFDKLVANDQYKKLNLDQICYFLQSNKLKLYPEIRVFMACVEWLKYHESREESKIYELMQYVRFNTMKPEEFINIVTKNDLIKKDPRCNQLLIEGYEYFALPNKQYCCSSPRSIIRNEPFMVCVNESMYILNRREEIWQYLCQSQATCKTLSQKFVVVNNFLYACGGYSETNRATCDKCHRFDPRTGQWYSIASMNEKRQFFTLAAGYECIVAVGGVFGNVGNFYATFPVCSPIEVYSIENDTWKSLDDCDIPILKWPGVCVFKKNPNGPKLVFIVGGKLTDSLNHPLSQQSFIVNLETSEVELCACPITTRFNPSVFYDPNDEKIILFGGEDEKYRLAPCIEIFDLKTRQWSEVATIPVSLSYQCISSTCMIKSNIYYLLEEHDGPSSESYILKSAHFDINTWQFEAPVQLPHPSTLASKWCTLVFPQEFLEKCQALGSSCDDTDESYTKAQLSKLGSNLYSNLSRNEDIELNRRQDRSMNDLYRNFKAQTKARNLSSSGTLIPNLRANKTSLHHSCLIDSNVKPRSSLINKESSSSPSSPSSPNTHFISIPSISSISISNTDLKKSNNISRPHKLNNSMKVSSDEIGNMNSVKKSSQDSIDSNNGLSLQTTEHETQKNPDNNNDDETSQFDQA